MKTYRIHGDNIVECERIASIIINTLRPSKISSNLMSPSTVSIELSAEFAGSNVDFRLVLLPGFNKNKKKRWKGNIFDALKEAGSFFDETPDAIITVVEDEKERIILGIEFCSALQAGNQAWQRSARAFSIGRTGCPYIYIVDFVKYELDNNKDRSRKNLRFPNAAVPYSYVNYSKITGNFVAQLYIKSEEFDKLRESNLTDFDENNFGNIELGLYIVKTMLGLDASSEEDAILEKNMKVVQFLANHAKRQETFFTAKDWYDIYNLSSDDIIDYSVQKRKFGFHKKIAGKSHHGSTAAFIELVDRLGVGLAAREFPFGIIPKSDRPEFADKILQLYPESDKNIINALAHSEKHLVLAIIKGCKPNGSDDRPDRGLLPLVSMLSSSDVDIMTYWYGPIIENNLQLLDSNPLELANKNGLWKSILSLSNFIVLDVPVIAETSYDVKRAYDTSSIKKYYMSMGTVGSINPKPAFSNIPVNYGEDDVDTGIHYLFTHVLGENCFEGMCNPPGGDWSGFSVISGEYENRWLSLPRVSDDINGKRPDHILEVFGVFEKPLLLSIESKEKSADLETDVGTKLVTYIEKLMSFVPSAKRRVSPLVEKWQWGDIKVRFNDFETISAAAYLKNHAENPETVLKKKCEILFVMNPVMNDEQSCWEIEIIPSTERSKVLKAFIIDKYASSGDKHFVFN